MSIIIKGMEMPTNCWACPMVSGYEIADEVRTRCSTVRCRLTNTKRPAGEAIAPDCPLVPVPPHGRLIDADALKMIWDDEIALLLEKGIEYLDYHVDTLLSDFKHDVDKMPTIIPASFENLPKNERYSQDIPAEEGET